MQENTGKAIAFNSIILYIRLIIVSVCGLLYTRFGLEALGVDDYGLFSVIAGIISFVAIINTIMIATSNRFMAIAIGKGDAYETNCTFNVNLSIHVLIAIVTLLLSFPLGHWYVAHFVNYSGDFNNVYTIFDLSILASALSFIGVPFNGLLLAKERFFVFCTTDALSSIAKLIFTYILIDNFEDKLLLFTIATSVLTAYPSLVFIAYCKRQFPEITRFKLVKDKNQYTTVLKFSANMSIGAIAFIAKAQGSALIVNMFFNTAMNSALAIANSVNHIVALFANNIQKSISPQIVKSYAGGDLNRSTNLVCLSSKITYLVMLMVSIPFLLVPETIFTLWLKDTPDYSILFTRLLIIDILVMSLNAGVPDLVFATGKIRNYQLIVNGLSCASVVLGYTALSLGMPAETLFLCYILFSGIIFFIRPIILSNIVYFKINRLVKQVYTPSLIITLMLLPLFLVKSFVNGWALLLVSEIYFMTLAFFIGLSASERTSIITTAKRKLLKK